MFPELEKYVVLIVLLFQKGKDVKILQRMREKKDIMIFATGFMTHSFKALRYRYGLLV